MHKMSREKMELEKILQNGILELKNYILVNRGGLITSNEAVRVLYLLCKNLPQNESEYEAAPLYDLIVLCCDNLSNMKEKESNAFLMSIYHFVKYFCKLKMYSHVINLCSFVKEKCINENIKTNIYGYYVQLFSKEIFEKSKYFDANFLHETILFAIQAECMILELDLTSLFGRINSYPLLFRHSHINNAERNKFCLDFLKLIRTHKLFENTNYMLETYKILLNVMHITVHSISKCEGDFFPEFISQILEDLFKTMMEVCKTRNYASCIEVLVFFYKSIIKDVKQYNEKCLLYLTECNKKLRGIIRNYGLKPMITYTCNQIGKILKILFDYYIRVKDLWNDHFPMSLQIEILRSIEIVGNVLSKNTNYIEKCCLKCTLKSDIFNAISVSSIVVELVNVYIRKNLPTSAEFHQVTIRIIKDCCKHIKTCHQNGCEKYSSIWKYVGLHIHNLAVALYKSKQYTDSKLYTDMFISHLFATGGIQNADLCFKDSLGATLHLYASNCQFLSQKPEALLYLTLTILLSKEYRKKAMWSWIMIKSDQSEDSIKSKTINHILSSEQDELKKIYPEYKYDQTIAEELLMFELKYYIDNWSSRIPVTSCCNEICRMSNNVMNKTKAFVLTWDKFLVLFDIAVVSTLESIINTINTSNDLTDIVCLPILKFILYQLKMHDLIDKNLDHMNNTYIPLKSIPLQPYEEEPNPNDKCDIVPSYYNIKIDNLLNLYEILDDCVLLWTSLLDEKLSSIDEHLFTDLNINKFIKLTAYEYRLHHFQSQMIKSWILRYKLSKFLNDKFAILESIGFIVEYSDCKSKKMIELQNDAEELIKEFDKSDPIQLFYIIGYYINKSSGYLNCEHVFESYEALCTAETYFAMNSEMNKIYEARILHLKTKFLLIPCTFEILDHTDNILMVAQSAYNLIAEVYKSMSSKCTFITALLFEISLSNGWLYKYMRLPREVRCYSKESIILAQKCVVPIRTGQFLSLLAFTDLLDRQYLDCGVKLSGLTLILGQEKYASHQEKNIICAQKVDTAVDTNKKEIKEMEINTDAGSINQYFQTVLDVPVRPSQRTVFSASGSPKFRQPFKTPEFIFHSDNCNCYMCRNYEYQKLFLDTIHLEAKSTLYQGDEIQAEIFFKGGLMIFEKLRNKMNSFNSIEFSEKSEFIFTRLFRNMTNNFCTFLLDYFYFLIQKKSDMNNAEEILDKILKLNNNMKYENILFWNEVMFQKMNLAIYKDKSLLMEPKREYTDNELKVILDPVVPTIITPENKGPAPRVPLHADSKLNLNPVKHIKKISFDLSDSNSDSEKEPEKIATTPAAVYFKFKTPAKTPAVVPKIKIYTPRTVKQPSRSRSVSIPKPVATESAVSGTKVNKQLEERTKLLTKKLKSETKPVLKESNRLPGNKPEHDKVCKNLFDDLTDVTESIDKLSLKSKSTKNTGATKKKYSRIKMHYSSSSSSPDSVDLDNIKKNENVQTKCKILDSAIESTSKKSVRIPRNSRTKNKK